MVGLYTKIKIAFNRMKRVFGKLFGHFFYFTSRNQGVIEESKSYNVEEVFYTFENSLDFVETPLIFYIKNNINILLKDTLNHFNNFEIKIGLEIEFFATVKNEKKFFSNVKNFADKSNIQIMNITNERGRKQYEIQFYPYVNLYKLVDDYDKIKDFLTKNYRANFEAKPFYFDASNALQINISLNKNDVNLFAKDGESESLLMKNSVAGLIKFTNIFLPLYIKDKNCLKRYDFDFNNFIYFNGKIPAPVFNSWGTNNRTASIRIPIAKNIYDREGYFEENSKNRRIEFRVPSASANIKYVLYGVLRSIFFGIENKLLPMEATMNNMLNYNDISKQIKIEKITFEELINIGFFDII